MKPNVKQEIRDLYEKADRKMIDIADDVGKPLRDIKREHKYETNAHDLDFPKWVITAPNFSFIENGDYAINNPFMDLYMAEKGGIEGYNSNKFLIYSQWLEFYRTLSQFGLVYVQPNPIAKAKDLVFTANAGVLLPSTVTGGKEKILLSNFRSSQRTIETAVNKDYFELMGYETIFPEGITFEGFADLKPINVEKNIWVGGYGIRTELKMYEWLMDHFNITIIPVKMHKKELYHFDCNFFAINESNFMVSETVDAETIKVLEKYGECHMVNVENTYMGITNSIKVGNGYVMCSSDLEAMEISDPYYIQEVNKVNRLDEICYKTGTEPIYVDISGFYDLGAGLSCLAMPLDYDSILDI